MNKTTVQYVQDNYFKMLRWKLPTTNSEIIEDCISEIMVRLLRVDYDIDDPRRYLSHALRMEILNYKRNNKRVVDDELSYDEYPAVCIIDQVIEAQYQDSRLRLIKEKVQELTARQKDAIENFIKFGKTSLVPGNPNTNKAHFLNAVKALRYKLNLSEENYYVKT